MVDFPRLAFPLPPRLRWTRPSRRQSVSALAISAAVLVSSISLFAAPSPAPAPALPDFGIGKDSPPALVEWLNRYRYGANAIKPDLVKDLLSQGEAGRTVLERLALEETDLAIREKIFPVIAKEGLSRLGELLKSNQRAEADLYILLAASSGQEAGATLFAQYHLMQGDLKEALAKLPGSSSLPGEPWNLARAVAFHALGDPAAALRNLPTILRNQPVVLTGLYLEQGQWARLVQPPIVPAAPSTPQELGLAIAATRMTLAQRPYDTPIADLLAAPGAGEPERHFGELVRKLEQFKGDDDARQQAAMMLLLNDRARAGLELLAGSTTEPYLLMDQGRFKEGLEIWRKMRKQDASFAQNDEALLRWLIKLGLFEEAHALWQEMDTALAEKDPDSRSPRSPGSTMNTYSLGKRNLEGLAIQLSLDEGDLPAAETRALRVTPREGTWEDFTPLGVLFGDRAREAMAWWWFVNARNANLAGPEALQKVRDVMAKPAGNPEEATALVQEINATLDKDKTMAGARDLLLITFTSTLLRSGFAEQASQLLLGNAKKAPANMVLARWVAEWYLRQGKPEEILKFYQEAISKANSPVMMAMAAGAFNVSGDAKAANALQPRIAMKLLEKSQTWPNLDDEVHRLPKQIRPAFISENSDRLTFPGSGEWFNLRRQKSNDLIALDKQAEALPLYEEWLIQLYRGTYTVIGQGGESDLRAIAANIAGVAAIQAKKYDEAARAGTFAATVRPYNIDVGIDLVNKLDAAGAKAEADAIFQAYYGPLKKAVADFPKSPYLLNSVAWFCACTKRELDEGLRCAQRAVQQTPQDSSILDTLSEVQFQRGDIDQAIAQQKRCLEISPGRPYFKAQIERMQAKDKNAPIPNSDDTPFAPLKLLPPSDIAEEM